MKKKAKKKEIKEEKRNWINVEFPKELSDRIEKFSKENDRNKSYVIRKGAELFLDIFDTYQKKVEEATKKITVMGEPVDQVNFPKIYQIGSINLSIIERNLQDIMKLKNITNKSEALKALEENL
jgi:predicted DNA-binding protein